MQYSVAHGSYAATNASAMHDIKVRIHLQHTISLCNTRASEQQPTAAARLSRQLQLLLSSTTGNHRQDCAGCRAEQAAHGPLSSGPCYRSTPCARLGHAASAFHPVDIPRIDKTVQPFAPLLSHTDRHCAATEAYDCMMHCDTTPGKPSHPALKRHQVCCLTIQQEWCVLCT